jgi:uncharacterized protein YkwD
MNWITELINALSSLFNRPAPQPQPIPTPLPLPVPAIDPLIQSIFDLINQQRQHYNLQPLRFDVRIQRAATKYVQVMASADQLSHTIGSDIGSRITVEGYDWSTCGENIAWNYVGAQAVVAGWMASPGHRRNILDAHYRDTGIAMANNGNGPYYCQDFAA